MKILLIEDEEELRNTVREYLMREKFIVECAEDYASAMEKVNDYDYDCILLDIMLPGVDGLTLCRDLRPRFTGPIVMLTALDSDMNQILGLELGANDYILKTTPPRCSSRACGSNCAISRHKSPRKPVGRSSASAN